MNLLRWHSLRKPRCAEQKISRFHQRRVYVRRSPSHHYLSRLQKDPKRLLRGHGRASTTTCSSTPAAIIRRSGECWRAEDHNAKHAAGDGARLQQCDRVARLPGRQCAIGAGERFQPLRIFERDSRHDMHPEKIAMKMTYPVSTACPNYALC